MSIWKQVDEEDVELSEDGKTIDICIGADQFGNNYLEVPVELILKLLKV